MVEVTVAQAAKAVSKSPVTIRGLIAKGELKALKRGRTNYVDLNTVQQLFAKRSENASTTQAQSHKNHESAKSVLSEQLISALQTQVETLHTERNWLRKQLEGEQAQRIKLQEELLSVIAEMKAILSDQETSKPSRWLNKILGS